MTDGLNVFRLGRQIRNVGRLGQVVNIFARHGFGFLLEELELDSLLPKDIFNTFRKLSQSKPSIGRDTESLAIHFRKALEELGPSFVKLGQLLSVREDLLPSNFIKELRKLQSHVEPVSFAKIKVILHQELGDKYHTLLDRIDEDCLAAGSIGQVYAAYLKNGRRIVLKVQRPGVEVQVNTDLDLMALIAGLVEKHLPELAFLRPTVVVAEFRRAIQSELDFIREGASTVRIANNFAGKNYVEFPQVFWELTSSKVLALSFLDGISVADSSLLRAQGIEPKEILSRAVTCFIQMVFVDGYYHGDLHPGNIFALKGDRIAFIDFGVTIKINDATKRHMAGLVTNLVDEDYEGLVRNFVELSDPRSEFDYLAFSSEVANELAPFIGLSLKDVRTGKLLWNIGRIAAKFGAPMPTDLALFFRTLATLEGVAAELDPDFDVVAACQKHTGKIFREMYSPENIKKESTAILLDTAYLLRYAPYQLRRLLKHAIDGELQVKIQSDSFLAWARSLDRASLRISLSMIVVGLLLGSAIISHSRVLPTEETTMIAFAGFSLAGLLSILVFWSILRKSL